MVTKPVEEFIPRKIEDPKLSEILNQFAALIDETVNFGSHVFKWCFTSIPGGDENIPIFLSYRHIFELIDSISFLVKHSCIEPCKILLRAIFESTFSIEYILEKDTERRGMDFMVWNNHQELKILRRSDPDDQMYKEFRKKLEGSKVLGNLKLPDFPHIKEEIAKKREILKKPRYIESQREFKRFKRKEGRAPRWWFSLHNGPKNIEKLAEHLGKLDRYIILYKQWSAVVHGRDIIRGKISIDESGKVAVWQIRSPRDAQSVTEFAVSFALANINNFVDKFISNRKQEVSKWYVKEIRDLYLGLLEKEIIKVK